MNTATFSGNTSEGSFVRWSAVFGGVIILLTIQSLFNLLGVGVGLIIFTPQSEVIKGLASSSVVWLMATSIVSTFLGSWVTGYFSTNVAREGGLHGLITWALASLLMFILLTTSVGMVVTGAFNAVGQTLTLVGKHSEAIKETLSSTGKNVWDNVPQAVDVIKNASADLSPAIQQMSDEAQKVIEQTQLNAKVKGKEPKEQMKKDFQTLLNNLLSTTDENKTQELRQQTINFLIEKNNMEPQQAADMVDAWLSDFNQLKEQMEQKTEEAKQSAEDMSNKASNVLGVMTLTMVGVSVLGALASFLGGSTGARQRKSE